MKQAIKQLIYLLTLVVMVISLIYIMQLRQHISATSNFQSVKPTLRICAPTPQPPVVTGPNTPTPNVYQFETEPAPASSVTPLPISKITDLAPGLADRDKVYVYIMRCEGTFELFLVAPNTILTQTIPLNPGDVILNWIPPSSLIGQPPPRVTATSTPTRTPTRTGQPYPPPPGTPYP